MTIRAIIKTSNLVQLALVVLLGGCFLGLGRDLQNVNGLLRNFYHTDALLSELRTGVNNKYHLILGFLSTGDTKKVEAWQGIILAEKGLVVRPESSYLKEYTGRSLRDIADELILTPAEKILLHACLEQNEQMNSLIESVMAQARGQSSGVKGRPSAQVPPQPQAALKWAYAEELTQTPDKIHSLVRQLRALLYQSLLEHMAGQGRVLWWILGLATGGLVLLTLNMVTGVLVLHRRVVRPLDMVGRYAEEVAADGNPAPLRLRHGDELAGMFASLQKMKDALLSRIQALKTAERTAHVSRIQALRARSQALSSLKIAQKASSVQEDFLRRISHEIRTPLNAIIGMSYLCLQTRLGSAQRDYLSQINKSGSVLLDMFNRILDFASVNDGSLRSECAPFFLRRFLELLHQSVAAQAGEKNLALALNIAPDLPSRVIGDERHLEEVLRILLDNAVQYTDKGGVTLAAEAVAGSAPGKICLRFCVADSGHGISKEDQDKLFEPFAPGDMSLTRSGNGLGLGLALARHLVNLMGSEIEVDSAPGQGSKLCFTLNFDLPQEDVSTPTTVPGRAEPEVVGEARPESVVLVVDDNEINRQIAEELLDQAGIVSLSAKDGREAVNCVREHRVDLVLMDVQMPVMDGLEATRRIREMGKSAGVLPILAMTAHTDSGSRMDGRDVGMNDYLTKPVNPAELYAALEQWLPGGLLRNPMREAASGAGLESDETVINTKAGLSTVGGNEKLYTELLLRFVEHYGQSASQLRELLERNDCQGAARLAHTVKGVAANLGVERVTELTRQMEASLPGMPPGESLLRQFDTAMEEAREQVRLLHQRHGGLTATAGDRLLADQHRQRLLSLLESLPQRVETDWGGVESDLEAFIPLVEGTPYAEEFAAVVTAVNDFSPGEIARCVEALRGHLSGEGHEGSLLH